MSQRHSRRVDQPVLAPATFDPPEEWNSETDDEIKMKLENCICPVCFEVADKAVLTKCCRKVYCEYHCEPFAVARKACPTCRDEPFRYEIALPERAYIARFATKCPWCEIECGRGLLEEHKASCDKKPNLEEISASHLFPEQTADIAASTQGMDTLHLASHWELLTRLVSSQARVAAAAEIAQEAVEQASLDPLSSDIPVENRLLILELRNQELVRRLLLIRHQLLS